MIVYRFREPLTIHGGKEANPQVIGQALEAIREESGGELRPRAVVEAARDKDHPLHPHFEWNDAKAAEAYRLDQARVLIRSIQIEEDDEADQRPAYISIHGQNGTSYRTISEVLKSEDLQRRVLVAAERDLKAFEERYKQLYRICEIVAAARERLTEEISSRSEDRPNA